MGIEVTINLHLFFIKFDHVFIAFFCVHIILRQILMCDEMRSVIYQENGFKQNSGKTKQTPLRKWLKFGI